MKQGRNTTEKECILMFGDISGHEAPDNPTYEVDITSARLLTAEEIKEILNMTNQYNTEKT